MFAVVDPTGILVAYDTWDSWRVDRRTEATLPPAPLVPQGASFCGLCWGQGRIHRPARNGEGLVPTACATCGGTGLVR